MIPAVIKIKPDNIQVSKIFSWFKGDFTKQGSLTDFLNKYSRVKINEKASVSTLDYNWNLNEWMIEWVMEGVIVLDVQRSM